MSNPDYYGKEIIQLKIGDHCGRYFKVDDKLPKDIPPNGVFLGAEDNSVVVIRNGRLILAQKHFPVITKWGDDLDLEELIKHFSPVIKALREVARHTLR